jgi:hypothetical protein
MSITIVILSIVLAIFSVISILLHVLGIYFLHQPNSLETNQTLYLIHMSILEISFVVWQNITIYVKVFVNNSAIHEYIHLSWCAVGFSWNNLLIMLTFDRFLQVYLNLTYGLYISERKAKIIILFSYLVGICFGLLLTVINIIHHTALNIVRLYFYPMYGAIVIIMFALTYGYIYNRIRRGRSSQRVQSTNHREHRQRRGIFAPFWIIVTYIISIVIPTATFILAYHTLKSEKYMPYIYRLFWVVNFTADALIYILFNESIKKKFLRLIKWKQESVENRRSVYAVRYPSCTINTS